MSAMTVTKLGIFGDPTPTPSFQNCSSGSKVNDASQPKVELPMVNAEAGAGVLCINTVGGGIEPLIIKLGGIIK